MDVRKCAKAFVKSNDLCKLDYKTLENVLANLGFCIVRFDKSNPTIAGLFDALGLDEATKTKKCFTYVCEQYRQVFLAEYLSLEEYVFMLLHEIGHIKMHHIIKNNTYASDLDEKEAHEFAFAVLEYIDHKNKRQKASKFISNVLLSVFAIGTISLFAYAMKLVYDYKHSDDKLTDTSIVAKEFDLKPVETDTSISSEAEVSPNEESSVITTTPATKTEPSETEPPMNETEQITESPAPTTDTIDDASEEMYYITSGGTKYHKEFCTVIQNKTNVYYGSKEELEEMGYEPCQLCIGE